jgi:hypothetical protein
MARIDKAERSTVQRLDELEQRMFVLKIDYEKYFSGIEKIEPLREREELRRMVRDLLEEQIRNSTLRFRFQTLRARFQSLELYWTRNLVLIERGTHPKMRFRADAKDRGRAAAAAAGAPPEPSLSAEQQEVLRQRQEALEREERAYKRVYDTYMEARAKCGQSTDVAFDSVKDALKKQVRQIKANFQCDTVKFRIVVEDGKAKVKAIPQTG